MICFSLVTVGVLPKSALTYIASCLLLSFLVSLLQDPNALFPVKLADFGFAKHVPQTNGCRTLCGTPGYLAPEILERWPAYDTKCDIWSVGVILFLLLGGYLPFDDEDRDKVFDRTRNGQYDFRPRFWSKVSMGAKDLVSQCLTIHPGKRVSATEALKHDWMDVEEEELNQHKLDVNKLKQFQLTQAKRKMKAAVNTVRIKIKVVEDYRRICRWCRSLMFLLHSCLVDGCRSFETPSRRLHGIPGQTAKGLGGLAHFHGVGWNKNGSSQFQRGWSFWTTIQELL
jgi:serine/threonine protein kinase